MIGTIHRPHPIRHLYLLLLALVIALGLVLVAGDTQVIGLIAA